MLRCVLVFQDDKQMNLSKKRLFRLTTKWQFSVNISQNTTASHMKEGFSHQSSISLSCFTSRLATFVLEHLKAEYRQFTLCYLNHYLILNLLVVSIRTVRGLFY